MKLLVLVPSNDYKASAGARIRYTRLSASLAHRGLHLTMVSISEFDPVATDCDAVIISKCHDARSVIAAAVLSSRGKLVGVDLFDDYFSDAEDSRLFRHRNWLSQIIDICDFALCSTDAMARVVAGYRAGLPTHKMNDPGPEQDLDRLAISIDRKLTLARDQRLIRVAWFGVGDNPYFSAGLSDLAAHGVALRELIRHGFSIELTVLTNRRALTAQGLSLVNQLPVPTRVEEWGERAERHLLDQADVVFLPVNARNFSAAKSLNRAVTALARGCQVLSVGYPLYSALDNLIYRDPLELVADFAEGSMRFSAAAMGEYRHKMESLASAMTEAEALAHFLGGISSQASGRRPSLLKLVHGQSTRMEAHKLARSVSALSVASPFCTAAFEFDVVFRGASNGLEMLVSRAAAERLRPDLRHRLKRSGRYFRVDRGGDEPESGARAADWSTAPVGFQLARYSSTMKQIEETLADSFGPGRTIFSEVSPLPFATAPRSAVAA
jgi:hypothetical protein